MPVLTSVAERMMSLFAGSERGHGTHGVPEQINPDSPKMGIRGTAKTLQMGATLALWQSHLDGKRPLGIIPIKTDNTVMWGSIDIDDYNVDHIEVVERVERMKLPLVPCISKSGGLHLFVFLTEPAPAVQVQRYLTNLSSALGYSGSEVFPKQTEVLADRNDLGNWMVMPYFGSDYDGRIRFQRGVKRTGGEQTVEEFLALAEKTRIAPSGLAAKPRPRPKAQGGPEAEPDTPFGDGPPCLQHLAAQGVKPGMQNNTLLMMGVYYKKKYPGEWKQHLERANHIILSPPGSAEGLMSVIRSLDQKDYNYTCKTEPMASYCNSTVCRMRKHGVGTAGAFPVISGLAKLDTSPPVWFVDVGEHRIEVSTETLQQYPKFHAACMDQIHVCYMAMKQADWLTVLGAAMADVNLIETPPEVGRLGVFTEYLEEYLTNRQRGVSKDDLLMGRPWEDEENKKHIFQLRYLAAFLQREGVKDMTRGQMTNFIVHLGGGHIGVSLKGVYRNCWWVPSSVVGKSERVDAPEVKGVPI